MASSDEKAYIVQGFQDDLRDDGRSCRQSRRLSLSLGVLPQCSGSARCSIGLTEVIVGVKVGVLGSILPLHEGHLVQTPGRATEAGVCQ